jgi:hypothetical protein
MPAPSIAFPHPDDPDFLTELGGIYMASKMLFTATSVGLFEKLADGPLTEDQLAEAMHLPQRSVHVMTRALLALGVLELQGGRVANSRTAQNRLTGRNPAEDVRAGLRLYEQINLPLWDQFEHSVRTGQPAQTTKPIADFGRIFTEGVESFTRPAADALLGAYDFSRHRQVLDLCGGTGSYLLPLLRRYPALQATLFELPHVADLARRRLSDDPHGSQVQIVEGDALFDPLPEGHDVVLLANTVHLLSPDKVQRLFQRLRAVVSHGTRLVMPEHWMNATHTAPMFATLLAGTFLLLSGDTRTYSVDESAGWLAATGWKMLEHRPLFGAISLMVAEAV